MARYAKTWQGNRATNFRVPQNVGNFLTSWDNIRFARRNLVHRFGQESSFTSNVLLSTLRKHPWKRDQVPTGWVWTGAENLAPHRDSIPVPSSPYRFAIPTELSWPILPCWCSPQHHDRHRNQGMWSYMNSCVYLVASVSTTHILPTALVASEVWKVPGQIWLSGNICFRTLIQPVQVLVQVETSSYFPAGWYRAFVWQFTLSTISSPIKYNFRWQVIWKYFRWPINIKLGCFLISTNR